MFHVKREPWQPDGPAVGPDGVVVVLIMVGEFQGRRSRKVVRKDGSVVVRRDGSEWVQDLATLLIRPSGGQPPYTTEVELLGDAWGGAEALPALGSPVALDVSISTSVSGDGARVFREYKGWRRVAEVEALFTSAKA